mmetsp:Transcript_10142/g.37743  ORF Transcript_10142/g.37743 Transcript_10142/m.37743 type:complete len:217 (-) Transcript_10142:2192-2842(-)
MPRRCRGTLMHALNHPRRLMIREWTRCNNRVWRCLSSKTEGQPTPLVGMSHQLRRSLMILMRPPRVKCRKACSFQKSASCAVNWTKWRFRSSPWKVPSSDSNERFKSMRNVRQLRRERRKTYSITLGWLHQTRRTTMRMKIFSKRMKIRAHWSCTETMMTSLLMTTTMMNPMTISPLPPRKPTTMAFVENRHKLSPIVLFKKSKNSKQNSMKSKSS